MKTTKKKEVVVGYARSSVEIKGSKEMSVGEQEKAIRKYCEEKEYELSKIYIDIERSGENLSRPAIQELLTDFDENTSKVICYDIERISSSSYQYLYVQNELEHLGAEIEFTSGHLIDDPISQTLDEVVAIINAFPSLLPKEYTKQTKHHVRMFVNKNDLRDYSKFNKVIKGEPLYASTCGLSRSQIVLIAKILRLNLENDTEVKATFQF